MCEIDFDCQIQQYWIIVVFIVILCTQATEDHYCKIKIFDWWTYRNLAATVSTKS